jgi:hypothetical protein
VLRRVCQNVRLTGAPRASPPHSLVGLPATLRSPSQLRRRRPARATWLSQDARVGRRWPACMAGSSTGLDLCHHE